MEDRPAAFLLLPDRRHSAGLGHAVGAPGPRHAPMENRGYLCGSAVGSGPVRGVLLSRPAATVDGPVDRPSRMGVGRHIDSVRRRTPRLSPIPQLEIRARRGGSRLVLRPGVSAGAEYPRQHGDTRAGGHLVACVVCVRRVGRDSSPAADVHVGLFEMPDYVARRAGIPVFHDRWLRSSRRVRRVPRSIQRPMIRSKRVVSVFSNAVIRAWMPDILESSAAMREVVMTANTVNIRPLKTMGTPIAR